MKKDPEGKWKKEAALVIIGMWARGLGNPWVS